MVMREPTIINSEFRDLRDLLETSAVTCTAQIETAADAVADCFRAGGKLLICGNGGSAADSQHLAAELVSSFQFGLSRPSLPAVALTTDGSILTAYSNDFNFTEVFARQVAGLAKPGDLLVAISTSGESKNVLSAIATANSAGVMTLALTGRAPNTAAKIANLAVTIPSTNTQLIQNVHQVVEHLLVHLTELKLFPHLFDREEKPK